MSSKQLDEESIKTLNIKTSSHEEVFHALFQETDKLYDCAFEDTNTLRSHLRNINMLSAELNKRLSH